MTCWPYPAKGHPCAQRRWFHQCCIWLASAASKTWATTACVPRVGPSGAGTFLAQRSHPRGAESPAHRRSPADEAVLGLAVPRFLSIRDQVVTVAANGAGDCSTALTVPGLARLHSPWATAAVRTPKPSSAPAGAVPTWHCHLLTISSP